MSGKGKNLVQSKQKFIVDANGSKNIYGYLCRFLYIGNFAYSENRRKYDTDNS